MRAKRTKAKIASRRANSARIRVAKTMGNHQKCSGNGQEIERVSFSLAKGLSAHRGAAKMRGISE